MLKQVHKCWIWKGLWVLSVLAFVLAIVASKNDAAVFGFDAAHWYWNALLFGVLSVPIKLDCQACQVC